MTENEAEGSSKEDFSLFELGQGTQPKRLHLIISNADHGSSSGAQVPARHTAQLSSERGSERGKWGWKLLVLPVPSVPLGAAVAGRSCQLCAVHWGGDAA